MGLMWDEGVFSPHVYPTDEVTFLNLVNIQAGQGWYNIVPYCNVISAGTMQISFKAAVTAISANTEIDVRITNLVDTNGDTIPGWTQLISELWSKCCQDDLDSRYDSAFWSSSIIASSQDDSFLSTELTQTVLRIDASNGVPYFVLKLTGHASGQIITTYCSIMIRFAPKVCGLVNVPVKK